MFNQQLGQGHAALYRLHKDNHLQDRKPISHAKKVIPTLQLRKYFFLSWTNNALRMVTGFKRIKFTISQKVTGKKFISKKKIVPQRSISASCFIKRCTKIIQVKSNNICYISNFAVFADITLQMNCHFLTWQHYNIHKISMTIFFSKKI